MSEAQVTIAECEAGFPFGAGIAVIIVAGILGLAWAVFIINGRYGCLPLLFIRFIGDKNFLQEYERRLDRVVEHDLKKKYHVGRKLGEGVTSAVFRIQERTTGTFYALKKIPLKGSASLQRAVEREIKILKKLRHHHVTTLHDVFQSPNRIWAILEFVSGGELTYYITMHDAEWDESYAARAAFQVLSAIAYLHSQGVVHRDIKLANLLRSSRDANSQMKVADFGAACLMEVPDDCAVSAATSLATGEPSPSLTQFKAITAGKECIGTPCNMAPEVFDRRYGPMCDMWSFGCVLYELLLGEPPFDPYKLPPDDPEYHLKKNVRAAHYPTKEHPAWRELSDDATFVLTHLLTASPAKRLSAWEVLQHKWFKTRHRDPGSKQSSVLVLAKKTMVERRKSLSAPEKLNQTTSGGAGVSSDVATSGEEAAPPKPSMPAMAQPRREASLASLEGMLPTNAADADPSDIDSAVLESRKTGIGNYYGGEGFDEEVSRRRVDQGASTGEVQVVVRGS